MTAATTPQSGFGVAITWAGHDIGYIKDVDGPEFTRDVTTLEHHDLTNGIRTKLAGLGGYGAVNFTVEFIAGDTAGQKYLLADAKTGTERQVVITYPDGTTDTFNGICTRFKKTTPVNSEMTADISIEVNGDVTAA
jgi:hypothetical protein